MASQPALRAWSTRGRATPGWYDLFEILMIAVCTVLSDGEDCADMAGFGPAKLGFLRGFLKLEHGAPSHNTFSRLFRLLDPGQAIPPLFLVA
jgi:hypothetical protein